MNPELSKLREKANNLPNNPGVYLMLDENEEVIYVGKAKILKNRVTSYFRGAHNAKVEAMVDKVRDFNVILVKSEFEALILENSLIKKYQPHYNILLKDDKGYPFIVLDTSVEWPRFEISNKKKGKVFGPYGGRGVSRDIIEAINETFKLPNCSYSFPQQRACINFSIKTCDGWCINQDNEEYCRRIEQASMVLDGKSGELIHLLTEKMMKASDDLNFEYAATIRDRIRSIENLSNKERVTSGWAERNLERQKTEDNEEKYNRTLAVLNLLTMMVGATDKIRRIEAFDVSNLGDTGIVAAMTCHVDGKPYKKGYKKFKIKDMDVRDDYSSMYQAVYRRFKHAVDGDESFLPCPDLLLIDGGYAHASIAKKALEDLKLNIPVFGMVKDDHHKTRALMSPAGEEIGISNNQSLFVLIGKIQEETHRFAIEYQRSLRYDSYGSELDKIPGVGPGRKAELLRYFKTVKAVKNADYETLCKAVPKNTAKAILDFYESNNR